MENNKRLIDANEVIKKSITVQAPRNGLNMLPGQQWMDTVSAIRVIDVISAPTVDAKEVVHGRWVNPYMNRYGHPCHCCSICGFKASSQDKNYCPNCGSRMDGGK